MKTLIFFVTLKKQFQIISYIYGRFLFFTKYIFLIEHLINRMQLNISTCEVKI